MKHIPRPRGCSGGVHGVGYGTLRVRRRIFGKVATTAEAFLHDPSDRTDTWTKTTQMRGGKGHIRFVQVLTEESSMQGNYPTTQIRRHTEATAPSPPRKTVACLPHHAGLQKKLCDPESTLSKGEFKYCQARQSKKTEFFSRRNRIETFLVFASLDELKQYFVEIVQNWPVASAISRKSTPLSRPRNKPERGKLSRARKLRRIRVPARRHQSWNTYES